MTTEAQEHSAYLSRRLERLRAERYGPGTEADPLPYRPTGGADLAERLAATLDGEVLMAPRGRLVRIEGRSTTIAVDRGRLADLPGQPPADRPLVCLDTETTGLATAAGTVAFLIGLGWWQGDTFRQVQLVLPDHANEVALLDALASHLPPDAWLVTYNGRGFDWPLLVTRYRMARRAAPVHDGHLDLLPIVRRLFRHRMPDARLQTAERSLLGMTRHDDVDGWQIPERYLGFLRGGPAEPLLAVVRHNAEDVRSLARLVALLDSGYGSASARRQAPMGDIAGLARAYSRVRRPEAALACLDEVLARVDEPAPGAASCCVAEVADADAWAAPAQDGPAPARAPDVPWWSPRARPDFGGRPPTRRTPVHRRAAFAMGWDAQRIGLDRAHLLRRLGRYPEAAEAWAGLAAGPGRGAVVAWIELAKLREHRLSDPVGALEATQRGATALDRRRRLGMPEPALDADLRARTERLRRRVSPISRTTAARAGHDPLQVRHPQQPEAFHGE